MKLEHLLLGVLALKPATGYDLKKYMDSHGRFLRTNTQMSQVYRSLATMEDRSWVVHRVEPRPGATDAKRYSLTEAGATVFLDWLTGPYHPPTRFEEPDLGARLAFAGFMTRQDVIRLLDVELEARTEEVSRFRFRDRHLEVDSDLPFDTELAERIGEWSHRAGAEAKDAHIARIARLRQELLDAPETAPTPPAVTAPPAQPDEEPAR